MNRSRRGFLKTLAAVGASSGVASACDGDAPIADELLTAEIGETLLVAAESHDYDVNEPFEFVLQAKFPDDGEIFALFGYIDAHDAQPTALIDMRNEEPILKIDGQRSDYSITEIVERR